ncbi:peptidylprolyl isomerase/peptidyl-prolyl cis-trans isomerase B (cyclophilin B) [Algoriphagus ratkowskyi]|uniref:Peptidyl-prolyl cis-trans isomerase n=1 Tax=Algoriphagus ratkowskyi TaxID=57028 RepID=A0A2W7RPE7_9BACT|nr:peptidylprolyl isomerase [Algoriphagus ratkowskyi]PZX60370.1 peptidylprolyl isomerase/peptidyl-prolyl cis-trans isomerase B (cyclophilin B) [Algoriphagus ratkowskyi]TXD78185.1 peptidylprolyl isomerase [Algoriphagus ratkowskyi]
MKINLLAITLLLLLAGCHSMTKSKISKKDFKKDIELVTTEGTIVLRLYDDTPLSRNNFLRLVKTGMYDSIQFHRVIEKFMIQAGERVNEAAFKKNKDLHEFNDLIPAEFTTSYFHKRGALGAAREGDDVNPKQQGSFIQFYIVQGRTYTDSTLNLAEKRINKSIAYNHVINDPANETTFNNYQELAKKRKPSDEEAIRQLKSELDSLAEIQLKNMSLFSYPEAHRETYKTVGGAAHLDQNYTVFGEVVSGMDIVDKIAAAETGNRDKPVKDILILSTSLIDRKAP